METMLCYRKSNQEVLIFLLVVLVDNYIYAGSVDIMKEFKEFKHPEY